MSEQNTSKTPRTDAAQKECVFDHDLIAHARRLEIELGEAKEANIQANKAIGDIANECQSYVQQLTAAQAEISELRRLLNQARGVLTMVREDVALSCNTNPGSTAINQSTWMLAGYIRQAIDAAIK